jgi:hypothetical protein
MGLIARDYKCEHGVIYIPQPSTLRQRARMVAKTETPDQSGRAFHPTSSPTIDRTSFRGSACTRPRSFGAAKGNIMELPAILRGDSLTRLLQGAAAGAVLVAIVGFNWGGWVTGGTAKDMVQRSSSAAVIAALSPICVDKFQHSAEAAGNLIELKKVSSYQQGTFIEKGGWATLPGSDAANSSVAQACANMLNNLK